MPSTFGRPRALVCDDEKVICFVCERALASAGYEVTSVTSGREAVDAVAAVSYDVLLLDVRLPDLDGPGVLREIGDIDPDLPVVVISAYSSFEDAIDCLRRGAVDFLRKPFGVEAVVRASDRALGSTHLKADAAVLAAAHVLFSSLDPVEVTGRVLRVLRSLLRADEAGLAVMDGGVVTARRETGEGGGDTQVTAFDRAAWQRVALLRDPVLLARDAPADAGLLAALSPDAGEAVLQRLAAGERTVGAAWVARPPGGRRFGERDLRRVKLLGGHMALAVDNARLHAQTARQARELEHAIDRLVVTDRIATVGRLSTGLGHEIANPASAVLANLEVAAGAVGERGDRVVLDALARAQAGANAIIDICQRLRPIYGAAPGGGPASVRKAAESADLLASHETRPRARVTIDLPPDLPLVRCDQAKLGQVFLNLLLNAGAAIEPGAPEDNEIRIGARVEGTDVVLTVQDTGSGVAPLVRERIFEPDVSGRRVAAGHGMGLAVCRWIVEEAFGSIRCLEVPRGASFEVRLPVVGPPAAAEADAAE